MIRLPKEETFQHPVHFYLCINLHHLYINQIQNTHSMDCGLRFYSTIPAYVSPRQLSQLVDGETNDDDDNSRIFDVQIPEGATMVPDLEQLILAQSQVDIQNIDKVNVSSLQRLGSILGQSTNLRRIKVGGVAGCEDIAQATRELIDLILRDNRSIWALEIWDINHSGSVDLHNFIQHNPNLTHVTLIQCGLTSACLDNLSESLMGRQADTIETICLAGNNFGDTNSWENFVSALGNSSRLEQCLLLNCGVGVVGATALARLLTMEQTSIKELALGFNPIGDEGLVKLTEAMKSNSTLSTLGFGLKQQITERGWQALLNLVCSSGTIEKVYDSNHTLKDIDIIGLVGYETTKALGASDSNLLHASMQINRKSYNQKVAARYKIILRHSRGDLELGDCGFEAALIPDILAFFWCGFEESEDDELKMEQMLEIDRDFPGIMDCRPPLARLGVGELRLDSVYRIIRKHPDIMNQPQNKGGGVSNKRKRCS